MLCQKRIGLIKERADLAWSPLMLYIRICVLLYVCSAVYETRTYGAMRGARGVIPYIYSIFLPYLCNRKSEEMRLAPEMDSEEMTLVGVITFKMNK